MGHFSINKFKYMKGIGLRITTFFTVPIDNFYWWQTINPVQCNPLLHSQFLHFHCLYQRIHPKKIAFITTESLESQTYPWNMFEVFVQGEIFSEVIRKAQIIKLWSSIHRNVQIWSIISGNPAVFGQAHVALTVIVSAPFAVT